jgi:O-antigen/teichoic acid export membrane protein
MVLFKFIERSLGLVSTLILVRVLAPQDFGVVAMALSFIAMAELLTAFGFDIALIQKAGVTEAHYDSAWTGNVILGSVITALMLAAAAPIAAFYGHPEVFWVALALAFGPLLGGLENIGVVAFRKELQFRREFLFQLSRKLVAFAITVPLAFALRSYWALVAGILVSRAAGTVISYLAHPFRPRLSLVHARELVGFSKWLLLNNGLGFVKERATDFFIGRALGPAPLGTYAVSYEFANLPTTELAAPINRALLPGFSRLAAPGEVVDAWRHTVGVLAIVALPAAFGLCAVAGALVPVVLGPKWLAAIEPMRVLAVNGAALLFQSSICSVLIARGAPQAAMQANAVYVVLLIGGIVLALPHGNLTAIALAVLTATGCAMPVYLYALRRHVQLPPRIFFAALARPAVAAAAMGAAVYALLPPTATDTTWIAAAGWLLFFVATGAVIYAAALLLLWLASGRPQASAERIVLDRLAPLLRRASARRP